jgi:hypothetical protein
MAGHAILPYGRKGHAADPRGGPLTMRRIDLRPRRLALASVTSISDGVPCLAVLHTLHPGEAALEEYPVREWMTPGNYRFRSEIEVSA